MPTDLSSWTPVQVDTALSEIYARLYQVRRRVHLLREDLRHVRGPQSGPDYIRFSKQLAEAQDQMRQVQDETVPFQEEFRRRGGWTRAFLVTSSNDGHVHSTTSCPTCRATTEFIWLPEYSGSQEATIVADAGERACTSCYPTAPVEVRTRPTRIFSPQEKAAVEAREQRAAQREARLAAQKAKAITAPDGQPLRLPSYGLVKTERTAQMLYVERAAEALAEDRGLLGTYRALDREELEPLLEALAHKRGQSVDETRAALSAKVEARVRRDYA